MKKDFSKFIWYIEIEDQKQLDTITSFYKKSRIDIKKLRTKFIKFEEETFGDLKNIEFGVVPINGNVFTFNDWLNDSYDNEIWWITYFKSKTY